MAAKRQASKSTSTRSAAAKSSPRNTAADQARSVEAEAPADVANDADDNSAATDTPTPNDAEAEAQAAPGSEAPQYASKTEEAQRGSVKAGGDLRMAWEHHKSAWGRMKAVIEWVFHYFFVGSVGLLGLAILFSIPILVLAAIAAVLATPGYILHSWFGADRHYFSPLNVVVTIFWAGYFFTHGWPRLRTLLGAAWTKLQPALSWVVNVVTRLSEPSD